MSLVHRIFGQGRVREARRQLARDPSPLSYSVLAHEHAARGDATETLAVCEEGLAAFPGSVELARLAERARCMLREGRLAQLKQELAEAPRPALWRELFEIELATGQLGKAEDCALQWLAAAKEPEAQLALAKVRVQRFLADRGRELGRRALDALAEVQRVLPRDERAWQLQLDLCARIGAWEDARAAAHVLLGLKPGDPALEARYRALEARAEQAPTLEQALREVERSGRLVENAATQRPNGSSRDLRPVLKRMAQEPGVGAAVYVRGATALVQGPKGATAERTARAVRALVQSSRSHARRLGLGQVSSVVLEGNFGTFAVAAGEMDAGALLCTDVLSAAQQRALMDLAGTDAEISGSDA